MATTLHAAAAAAGTLEQVQQLLTQGADANAADQAGTTPLMHAARSTTGNFIAVLKQLLHAGADVTSVNSKGCTALHLAARYGQVAPEAVQAGRASTVELLLAAGAPFNIIIITITRVSSGSIVHEPTSLPRCRLGHHQTNPAI
jgi:ankyrin repeat protein